MKKLIVLAFVGFLAQLVDGSLGMAYGVTSSSLLLAFGIAPAVASASVHLSEVVTTAASGVSHIKFGNVDRNMIYRLIIPGSIGAFTGACFLSNLPGDIVKTYVSTFLLLLGFIISLGWDTMNWLWVGALMLGGLLAAPIAAWLVRMVPTQLMGILVGGFIILVNTRTILNTWVINHTYYPYIYALILLGWGIAIVFGVRKTKTIEKDIDGTCA